MKHAPVDEDRLDLSDWFLALEEKLERADAKFKAPGATVDGRREAALEALASAGHFLGKLPRIGKLVDPLLELAHAVDEVNNGRTSRFLTKTDTTTGGTTLTIKEKVIKAHAVAAFRCLREAGWGSGEAKKIVSEELSHAGITGNRRKKPVAPSTIGDWQMQADIGEPPELPRDVADATNAIQTGLTMHGGEWPPSKARARSAVAALCQALAKKHLPG